MNNNQITSILKILSDIDTYNVDKIPDIIFKDQDIVRLLTNAYEGKKAERRKVDYYTYRC